MYESIAVLSSRMSLESRTHKSLSKAALKAARLKTELSEIKMVVFSDHHRGMRDDADDFVQCESTYKQALSYYLSVNYKLLLLGDVEELWENPLSQFNDQYEDVQKLERDFFLKDRLIRIWGNHDDFWREKAIFNRYQGKYFKGLTVHESLIVEVSDDGREIGEIVFLHGHQGDLASDRFATISRFLVRWLWRPWQKITGAKLSTASRNLERRSRTDELLYEWVKRRERAILIAGHTHQAVFSSSSHIDYLEELLRNSEDIQEQAQIVSEMNRVRASQTHVKVGGDRQTCYFNSGCCSFEDGDITGLEIDNGQIRLIKWSREGKRIELRSADLQSVF